MIPSPEPNMKPRCMLKFIRNQPQRLRRTAALISSDLVRSSDSDLHPFSTARSPSKLPISTAKLSARFVNCNLFSVACTSRAMDLVLPSFDIHAGHGIGSQARPDFSAARWTRGADFHSSILSCNIPRRLRGPLDPKLKKGSGADPLAGSSKKGLSIMCPYLPKPTRE